MKNNYLYNKFLKYEEENHLFDIEFNEFKIWEILRSYIYIEIELIYNQLQFLFPQNSKKKKVKINFSSIQKSLKIFFVKNRDLLFLNNPRRVRQQDGKYYCIYTDLLIDVLKNDFSVITFEDPYWALSSSIDVGHFEPVKTESICYLDLLESLFKLKKYFFKIFNKVQYNKLHKILVSIRVGIEEYFDCNLSNIFEVGEDKILYLILMKSNYEKIIKRVSPKVILEFYDVFPSKILVNKIAKELNIPIIELQHGVVTSNNPIFLKYYNLSRGYDCLPDYVFSYGKKLLNKSDVPIKKENIFYTGSLFLEYKKKEYKKLRSGKKKNILFISQSNLGNYISAFAGQLAELLKDNKDYHIFYKMHPYEIGVNYECLKKENITIVDNKDKDLYYFQAISVAQIGVYSTGLYEGLAFNLLTFIINHDYGSFEIKEVLKEGDSIYYVNTPSEVINKLKKTRKKIDSREYWAKCDSKSYKKYILKIINGNLK